MGFSTFFVDNLLMAKGYKHHISWGIAYICRMAEFEVKTTLNL
ncbi:MAG: hypothetical protein ACJART_001302 [Maribacter sp.]|jgi:hypothetical protein